MNDNLNVSKTVTINAPTEKVWNVLTTPAHIKKFLFGTETTSDWKAGGDIRFHGEYQGKSYEDKGKIIEIKPEKILHHTYWSSMGGKEDKPENYVNVKYLLDKQNGKTNLTITQDGIKTDESKKHLEENWGMVINNIKKVAEEL
jgi:uncharacterized protein YndB with AHSA1/START domain